MRKLGIVFGVLIVVVVMAVLLFAATFDVNKYQGTIQSQLETRLGRQVKLGEMKLNMFPPRLRVENPVIADDDRFSPDAPFVKAQELFVSVKLAPLIHKQVEINSLELQRPSVNLIRNTSGVWNFASLGHPQAQQSQISGAQPAAPNTPAPAAKQSPSQSSPSPSEPSKEQQFSLAKLTIRDGQVSLLDQSQGKTPSLYDHIDVTLTDFAPDRPFTIDAAVHMAGTGAQEVRLSGKGGPIVSDQPAATPFQGTLDLKQVGIADLSKFLSSPAMAGTDGVLTGKTNIRTGQGAIALQGETNLSNAKIKGMELGYPLSAKYDVSDDLTGNTIAIRSASLSFGQTPLQLNGTVNTKPSPMQLAMNVRANNVSLVEVAKLLAASGVALSPGTTVAGNATVNLDVRGAANKPALNGTVNASNIQMSGKDMAQPVQIPSINLNLTPAQVQSAPFNMVSGGTTLNAQVAVHNYLSPSPVVNATVAAPNAQLPAILSLAKAYGVTALDKVNGEGTMKLDLRASGPVKSLAKDEILKTLNGSVNVNFSNVKYSGANLTQQLSSIAGFLGANAAPQNSQGVTNISKMTGDIAVRSGIAQTSNLQADLDMGTIGATGTANLADEALNMRVTAVLSQGFSQKVGGQNVGGFMKTALANNQGQLVVPALVTGTFSKPVFAPDVQQLAQMKVKNLIPNLSNAGSVAGTLGNLLGGSKAPAQNQQQQAQQPASENNPVQQVMGLFGKKKPSKAEPPQPPK